jgi:hypothetical protein
VQGILLLTTVALLALRRQRFRGSSAPDAGSSAADVAPEVQPG